MAARAALLVAVLLTTIGLGAAPASAGLRGTPWAPAATGPSSSSPSRATPRIVGGAPLPTSAAAPYTVAIFTSVTATTGEGCSGTVIDALHVITAAHCFVQEDGTRATPAQVKVVAGSTSYYGAASDPGATTADVAAVRVHPRYLPAEFDDDVAVVTLAAPLDLTTGRIAALPLPAPGSSILARDTYAYGSRTVRLTGFGISTTGGNDYGTLRAVDVRAIPIAFCQQSSAVGAAGTDAPAVLLCSDRKGTGACQGDSGGTAAAGPDGARFLAGVIDTSGEACEEGRNLYADVAAPEIRTFIDAALQERDLTAAQTPLSPRGGRSVELSGGAARVGRTVRCLRGSWRSGSTFRYAFVFVKGGKERNRGLSRKSTYRLRPSDRGWSVSCAVRATNAGGTGSTFWPFTVRVR